jgi:hypothetical protein
MVHPRTRTVCVNGPTNIMGVGARLDHILAEERRRGTTTETDDRHSVPDADCCGLIEVDTERSIIELSYSFTCLCPRPGALPTVPLSPPPCARLRLV